GGVGDHRFLDANDKLEQRYGLDAGDRAFVSHAGNTAASTVSTSARIASRPAPSASATARRWRRSSRSARSRSRRAEGSAMARSFPAGMMVFWLWLLPPHTHRNCVTGVTGGV